MAFDENFVCIYIGRLVGRERWRDTLALGFGAGLLCRGLENDVSSCLMWLLSFLFAFGRNVRGKCVVIVYGRSLYVGKIVFGRARDNFSRGDRWVMMEDG